MTPNLVKGIQLSLFTMFFWALHDVAFRLAAVKYKVEPTVFICLTLFVAAVVLILIAGPGKGGLSTLKRGHTWAYGVIAILLNIAQIFALTYITTTEMNFLNRFTIIMSIIGAWMFFSRPPKKSDLLGISLVLAGLYYIAVNLNEEVRVPALVCIFFVALTSTATAMIGEKHPDSNNAHTIKDRCRVTGFVLLVCSLVFLVGCFGAAMVKAQSPDLTIPLIAGLPNVEDFLHKPTFFIAVGLGLTLIPLAMYFFFYATRVAKAETFMFVSSTLPFITYAVEYAAFKAGLLDIGDISMSDMVAGLVIVLGAILIEVMRMDRKKHKNDPVAHSPVPASSADYDMVCSALRFCDDDMLQASRLLGVEVEELEEVHTSGGSKSFDAEGDKYKTLLRNYRRNIATADNLTGLVNRDGLLTALDAEIKNGIDLAVIFIDLNKFKPVNDTYGHEAGDELLKKVAKRLKGECPNDAVVSRLGGDEFVIMLRHVNRNDAQVMIEELNTALEEPFTISQVEGDVEIGGSFGLAMSKEDGETSAELIKHADEAMYEVKRER